MVGLAFAIVYELFLAGPAQKPKPKGQNSNTPSTSSSSAPSDSQTGKPNPPAKATSTADELAQQLAEQLADRTPLDLSLISAGVGEAKVGERGNLFVYPPPPPPPREIPKPPPPITLQAIQPNSATAGTPRAFTLKVIGVGFPPDAQILLDDRAKPTARASDSTLTTEIAPEEYSFSRGIKVDVRSKQDPSKSFSNSMMLTVAPSPDPNFKYVGRIGASAVLLFPMAGADNNVKRCVRGEIVGGFWRVDSISDQGIEVTDTTHDIKKRVPLQEKTK